MRRARKQNAQIYQYFQENCKDMSMQAAREHLQSRFPGITTAKWHNLKRKLSNLQASRAEQRVADLPTELTCHPQRYEPQPVIPEDTTPEAKAAISQMVAVNCQQECRIQTLQVENSVLKDGVGRSESRVRVLKDMLKVVLAAM